MIGDFLYGITEQEARSAPIVQRYSDLINATASAVSVTADSKPVPKGRVLHVTHLAIEATAGAATKIQSFTGRAKDDAGNDIFRIWSTVVDTTAGVPQFGTNAFPGCDFWLMEGEFIRGVTVFDSGANPNTTRLSVVGLLYPRGNMQRAGTAG